MTGNHKQAVANASRLVNVLAELGGVNSPVSHAHFTRRLGQMYDLADSIGISALHGGRAPEEFAPSGISTQELTAEFLRGRAAILSSALRSFDPGSRPTRLRFPSVSSGMSMEETLTVEPYLAFYATLQRDTDFRCRNLQAATREAVAGISPKLARLAALDAALGAPLADQHRRFFSAVSAILRERIETLLSQHHQGISAMPPEDQPLPDTLTKIRTEIQELLLAEIDARLLPATGLIEAMNELQDDGAF